MEVLSILALPILEECRQNNDDLILLNEMLKANRLITALELQFSQLNTIDPIVDTLKSDTIITHIYLDNNLLGCNVLDGVMDIFSCNLTITILSLNSNGIFDRFAIALAEILKKNNTLIELYL